jgi:hypothetical protein
LVHLAKNRIRRKKFLAAFIAAMSVVLAGCSQPSAGNQSEGESMTDDDVPGSEAETELAPAGGGSSEPGIEDISGVMRASASAEPYSFNGADLLSIADLEGTVTGWIVEVSWTAETPAFNDLAIWGRPSGGGNGLPLQDPEPQVIVQGSSPLRLPLPATAVEETPFVVFLRPARSPGGVAVSQPFEARVATFDNISFDPNYAFS